VLAQVLGGLPEIDDPNVLVGNATADDAGVYRLNDDLALVLTVDFFTPIVDDPRSFGRIAAANSLSDIYAMGARPLSALAIAAFPEEGLPVTILSEILRGGAEKAREAGISVIGGHTIKDPEPKYGLSVTGVVHPDRVVRNSTAKAGDLLVLTKPLGTGILTTARRRDLLRDEDLAAAVASMEMLNRAASEAMIETGVSAATDVTGFGLIGHLREVTTASGIGAEIDSAAVPLFDEVIDLAARGCAPGGTKTNLDQALSAGVTFADSVSPELRLGLCDAQTSGGLLIAVPEDRAERLLGELAKRGVEAAAVIGRITKRSGIAVR
jgi:selenide, water dikinase